MCMDKSITELINKRLTANKKCIVVFTDTGHRTIGGSVGSGHHHHSGLEQRLEQLFQDHGISDVGHLTEEEEEEEAHPSTV